MNTSTKKRIQESLRNILKLSAHSDDRHDHVHTIHGPGDGFCKNKISERVKKHHKNQHHQLDTLYSNGVQLNYERLLSPKRSITVFGGYIEFPMPTIIANSSLEF